MKKPCFANVLTYDYLYKKYVINKLSCKEIGDTLGYHKDTILKYLKKHNIARRNTKNAQQNRYNKKEYTKLLNNIDFLKQEYIINKKTIRQLSKELSCSCKRISDSLVKNNFKIVNHQHENLIIDEEIITAGLLGDAGLKQNLNGNTIFYKKNKYRSHVLLTAKTFYPNCYENRIFEEDVSKYSKYNFIYYQFKTKTSPELNKYYKLWYPNSTKKQIIPDNIPITPKVLLHWFLDDGSSIYRKRNEQYKQKTIPILVYLSTDSFEYNSQLVLTQRIYEQYKLKISITPIKHQWRMRIPSSQTNLFFEIIGECPVPELQYKWKHPYIIGDKNANS